MMSKGALICFVLFLMLMAIAVSVGVSFAELPTVSQKLPEEFEIARGFFSDILNAQLVIFSVIVGVVVSSAWFLASE